jgi:hypothetical protein
MIEAVGKLKRKFQGPVLTPRERLMLLYFNPILSQVLHRHYLGENSNKFFLVYAGSGQAQNIESQI